MTATIATPARIDPARAIATLVLAFSADPPVRWLFPNTNRYHSAFPELMHLLGRPGFDAGTVDLADADAGVAVWLPPGAEPDRNGYVALFQRSIDPARHHEVFGFVAQVAEQHPTEPHWYLLAVGVDPHLHGRGYGSTLLLQGLARCDRDGLPAYLEASTPRSRALYERHGFEVQAEIRVADSPPVWPMLRPGLRAQ